MKSFLNHTAAGLFRAMPVKAAQHLLFLAQAQHDTLDRWGYHIRPVHFYEPLPDFASITKEKLARRRCYPALDFDWTGQTSLIQELVCYRDELEYLSRQRLFDFANSYFGGFDAAVYYGLIRRLKPQRLVEIGSGYSSLIAEKALVRNRECGSEGNLTCIEPYPGPQLTKQGRDFDLIAKPVQEIGIEFFSQLEADDVLFIDSSHTVKFGSDVCYLFLEILPTLNPGVWIHIHDIFFPNDYPAEWLLERRLALNEQYLLEAFLAFNHNFNVRLSNHWLCLDYAPQVQEFWPRADGAELAHAGSSFWICKRSTDFFR